MSRRFLSRVTINAALTECSWNENGPGAVEVKPLDDGSVDLVIIDNTGELVAVVEVDGEELGVALIQPRHIEGVTP